MEFILATVISSSMLPVMASGTRTNIGDIHKLAEQINASDAKGEVRVPPPPPGPPPKKARAATPSTLKPPGPPSGPPPQSHSALQLKPPGPPPGRPHNAVLNKLKKEIEATGHNEGENTRAPGQLHKNAHSTVPAGSASAHTPDPRPKDNKKYHIGKEIGKGGTSTVHHAEFGGKNGVEQCAVKVVNRELGGMTRRQIRDHEVAIFKKLQGCRGVPKYLEAFDVDNNPAYAMQVLNISDGNFSLEEVMEGKFSKKMREYIVTSISDIVDDMILKYHVLPSDVRHDNIKVNMVNGEKMQFIWLFDYGLYKNINVDEMSKEDRYEHLLDSMLEVYADIDMFLQEFDGEFGKYAETRLTHEYINTRFSASPVGTTRA